MVQESERALETGNAMKKVVTKLVAAWIVLPLFFLFTGGAFVWWEAWVYCLLMLVPMTVFAVYMARQDPTFFDRRFKGREKEQTQRRIQAWGSPFFLAVLVIPGLDRRFGWSDPPPAVVLAALVLALMSYLEILWVFLANRWAGRTVEVLAAQEVISTGPYAIVRHPMYVGVLSLCLATPVALGSWWGLLPMLAIVPTIVFRILNEEQVLIHELPGYAEYRSQVRWRLVPHVW